MARMVHCVKLALEYRKRFGPARPAPDASFREVQLHLSDGSLYPNPGKINFIANALDPTTGTFAPWPPACGSRGLCRPGAEYRPSGKDREGRDSLAMSGAITCRSGPFLTGVAR